MPAPASTPSYVPQAESSSSQGSSSDALSESTINLKRELEVIASCACVLNLQKENMLCKWHLLFAAQRVICWLAGNTKCGGKRFLHTKRQITLYRIALNESSISVMKCPHDL